MKRALITLLLLAGTLSAQAGSPVGFGVQLTTSSLGSAFGMKEMFKPGIGGGAHLDLALAPFAVLRLDGHYISFPLDREKYASSLVPFNPGTSAGSYTIDGGAIGLWAVSVNGKLVSSGPVFSPYLIAGAGVASIRLAGVTVTYPGWQFPEQPAIDTGVKPALNAGVGVDIAVGPLTLYAQGTYMWILTEGETSTYFPISIGVTF